MLHTVGRRVSRSRAACIADSPFFADSMRLINRNQSCKSIWLLWKIVPTVTLNDRMQRWHFQREAVRVRYLDVNPESVQFRIYGRVKTAI